MLSVMIYLGTYFLFYNMVLMRQMVSVVMFLYCINYTIEKKYIKCLLCFLVGLSFHLSMIVFLPAFFVLRYFKLNIWNIIFILIIGVFLKIVGAINLVMFVGGVIESRMANYLAGDGFTLNIMEYIKMIIIICAILILFPKLIGNYFNEILIKSYCVFFILIFAFGDIEIFFRIAMYFDLVILFLIPILFDKISMTRFSRITIYTLVVIFFAFSFIYRVHNFDNGEFYQYKFFFLE